MTWRNGNAMAISPNPYKLPISSPVWPINTGNISLKIRRLTSESFKEDRIILKIGNPDVGDMLKIQMIADVQRIRIYQGDQVLYQTPHVKKSTHELKISYIAIGEGNLKMNFRFDGEYQGYMTSNVQQLNQEAFILMGDHLAAENIIFEDLEIYGEYTVLSIYETDVS